MIPPLRCTWFLWPGKLRRRLLQGQELGHMEVVEKRNSRMFLTGKVVERERRERHHPCLQSYATSGTGLRQEPLSASLTTQPKAATKHVMESSAKRDGTFAQSRAAYKRTLCRTTPRSLDGVRKTGAGLLSISVS